MNINTLDYVEQRMVPRLTPERVKVILAANAEEDNTGAMMRAQRAAQATGIESDAVRASENLRAAAWSVMWGGTQGEAWAISWVLAKVGMGIATIDLVGTNGYTIEDYIALVQPWARGFADFPLPVKEET